jgi:hypothetical protein
MGSEAVCHLAWLSSTRRNMLNERALNRVQEQTEYYSTCLQLYYYIIDVTFAENGCGTVYMIATSRPPKRTSIYMYDSTSSKRWSSRILCRVVR